MPTAEELAKLTPAEIETLMAQANAEIGVFQARVKAGDEFTPDEVARFEHLADSYETLDGTKTALVEAEASNAERLQSLMERTAPKPAAEPEPEPAPEAAAPE